MVVFIVGDSQQLVRFDGLQAAKAISSFNSSMIVYDPTYIHPSTAWHNDSSYEATI